MKYSYLSVLFFCMICLLGCKDENATSSKKANELEEIVKQFKVKVKFKAKQNDDFCLLYTEDETINFGENGIWKPIVGSENEQIVEFDLPVDVFPTQLRLDLGIKPEQTDITIKSVVFEYNGKSREIEGSELAIFFRADLNTCTFDSKTGLVKPNVENGVRKNPSLYPQEPTLKYEIIKLAK